MTNMKAILRSETYSIKESAEGMDDCGLIPKGTKSVIVSYEGKSVDRVLFLTHYSTFPRNKKELKERFYRTQARNEKMNSRRLSQIQKEKIVGLLRCMT